LRGIDEQIAKAEMAVDGHVPVKRNRPRHPDSEVDPAPPENAVP